MQWIDPREPSRALPAEQPYLSVVVASRNDDHGGNFLRRMQIFVTAWIGQCQRHGLHSELIIVEWNPPHDRERLVNALRWPDDTGPCNVRIIEVAPQVHARYQHAAAFPLYQMIAKNVGIRRARGEFILATNIDVIFSDELMQFLASRRLERGRMYRINRYDAMSDVPDGSLDEQINYCRTHIIRLHARAGTFSVTPDGLRKNAPQDITAPDSGVNFGEGWYPPESYASKEVFRWIDNDAEVVARVPKEGAVLTLEVEPGPGLDPLPQLLEVFDENDSKVAQWNLAGRTTVALAVPPAGPAGLGVFRLRVPGGGTPVLHDQRILNLAVFRCDWAEPPNDATRRRPSFLSVLRQNRPTVQRLLGSYRQFHGVWRLLFSGPRMLARTVGLLGRRGQDILETGLNFQLGSGWSYLEESAGERFRWVSEDAQFAALRRHPAVSRIALLVEAGPGQGGLPFKLVVRDLHNHDLVIARVPVQGLTYLEFDVPAAPGTVTALSFSADTPGLLTGLDTRLLNFRVFACGQAGFSRPPSNTAMVNAPDWPALMVGGRPVTRDWNTEMEPFRQQLAGMAKPAFLHTNACGDFTLMAREHWFDLRGYGEMDGPSIHLDALLCYAAHHGGAREQVLTDPMRIYHIEHATGWTPERQLPEQRNAQPGIQSVSHDDLVWLITQMRDLRAPVLFNLQDWGLAEHNLCEVSPPASWGARVEAAP